MAAAPFRSALLPLNGDGGGPLSIGLPPLGDDGCRSISFCLFLFPSPCPFFLISELGRRCRWQRGKPRRVRALLLPLCCRAAGGGGKSADRPAGNREILETSVARNREILARVRSDDEDCRVRAAIEIRLLTKASKQHRKELAEAIGPLVERGISRSLNI